MLWLLPLLLLLLDNDIDHRPVPCHSIGSNIVWDRSTKALIQSQQSQTPCAVRHTAHTALAIDRKPAGNDIELLITFSAFKKRKTLSRNETQNKKNKKTAKKNKTGECWWKLVCRIIRHKQHYRPHTQFVAREHKAFQPMQLDFILTDFYQTHIKSSRYGKQSIKLLTRNGFTVYVNTTAHTFISEFDLFFFPKLGTS